MPNLAQILISDQTHALANNDVETYTSDKIKGDGYYGRTDGLHTVVWQLTDFVGTITIQGTLTTDPTTSDWVTIRLGAANSSSVDTTGLVSTGSISSITYSTATTATAAYNFTGNFVWLRATITNWTAGSVNSVKVNL